MKKCENPACENIVTEYMVNYPNQLKRHCSTSCKCSHIATKSLAKRKETCKVKYGVENPMQTKEAVNKLKQTMISMYGVENVSQLETVKQKKVETCLKNHGVAYSLQSSEIMEKNRQTNLKRRGVENPFQSPEVKEKIKQTNLERHGVEHLMQLEEIKEKIRHTNIEKHGADNWKRSHIRTETLQLLSNVNWLTQQHETKSLLQIANENNVSPHTIESRFKKFNIPVKRHAKSYFEKQVYEYILSIYQNIIQNDRTQIKPYELDVYLPTLNLAFECNGEYWHKEPQKEINKFNMCKEKGIVLHFIWYEDWKKDQEYWKKYIANIIKQKSPN